MMDLTQCSSSSLEQLPVPRYVLGIDIGMRNLAMCVLDADTSQVVFMDVLDILLQRSILNMENLSERQEKKLNKKCSKRATGGYELIEGLVQTLRNVHTFQEGMQFICHVIIENQPPALPHMQKIATAIHTFYTTILPSCIVEYMQPMHKFIHLNIDKKKLEKYHHRKKMAVQCCLERLEHFQDAKGMTQMAMYKKKDDIADAYLLALRAVSVVAV